MNFKKWLSLHENEIPTAQEVYTRYFKPIGMPVAVFREFWQIIKEWMAKAVTKWGEPAENGLKYLMTDNQGPASWQKNTKLFME